MIVLTQFRPPDEVAVYYAAAKTLALVAFIYFAVAQTVAHKFSEYHVAGDRKRLADFLAHAIRHDVLAVARLDRWCCCCSASRCCGCSAGISSPATI